MKSTITTTLVRIFATFVATAFAYAGPFTGQLPIPDNVYRDSFEEYSLATGEIIKLYRSGNEVAIKRKGGVIASAIAAKLKTLSTTEIEPVMTSSVIRENSFLDIIRVDSSEEAIIALNNDSNVEAVFPVLVTLDSMTRMIPTDEVFVQLENAKDLHRLATFAEQNGLKYSRSAGPDSQNTFIFIAIEMRSFSAFEASKRVAAFQGVRWAAPNFLREIIFAYTPNDTYFGRQLHLKNTGQNGAVSGADINATGAWDLQKGNTNVVIAIIDSGFDFSPRQQNLWVGGGSGNFPSV